LTTNYEPVEVIFVDNGSVDGSADFIRRNFDSKLKIVENKRNLGFSEGFNSGIRVSEGRYLALLSNDMVVDSNWLNPIVAIMESNCNIGIAGFKRMVYGTKDIIDGIGGNLHICGRNHAIGFFEIDVGQYDYIKDNLDYIGGAMVIRRQLLKEVGLFDKDYIIFSEDCDLCFRTRKHGYETVYVPDAVIWHKGQATLKGMDPQGDYVYYMSEKSRIRFALIHFVTKRVLSMFLIDLIWFAITNPSWKAMLVKAYWWNLRKVGTTLKRRMQYGPSPPFSCKYPILARAFSLRAHAGAEGKRYLAKKKNLASHQH